MLSSTFRQSRCVSLHLQKLLPFENSSKLLRSIPLSSFSTSSVRSADRTALYDLHVAQGGKMVSFGGYSLPVYYADQSIANSHLHTRRHVSIFDVSHMLQTYVRGRDAVACMESICTGDFMSLAPGNGTLTVFTNDKGGILDDLIVNKISSDNLYVVSNAAMKEQDMDIMESTVSKFRGEGKDVTVEFLPVSEQSLIAVQGPSAVRIVAKLISSKIDFNKLYFMQSVNVEIAGVENGSLTRCGYTGEDGFEISIPSSNARHVTEALLNIDSEVKLAGLGARDSLRLEAGLCLYGSDINAETTPVEANLSWLIDWRSTDSDHHDRVHRQLSVSSDSKLLDEDIREKSRVIMRPKKPPRPKSEVFLNKRDPHPRKKRFSAFGGDSPFGKSEAYIKLEPLGEGSYATVYKGFSNLTHQRVALKEIRLQEEEGAPFTAIREASLLKELKHSNIVTLHDIVHTRETLTFVFEYVNTDLSQYMEKHPGGLDLRNVRLFLFQLLRGLSYCHKRRVLHRDVKPQNLLISDCGELKLADFGLARAKSVPSHTYSHEVVTLWYRPPDVLLGSTEYSTSLDMWGVGCIFVEMVTGMPTFPGIRDTYDQLDKIFKLLGTPTEDTWPGVTHFPGYKPHKLGFYRPRKLGHNFPRLYDIIEGEAIANAFLQLNPEERVGAEEALHHPYFAQLPRKLYELPDETSIFTVEGILLYPETNRQSK